MSDSDNNQELGDSGVHHDNDNGKKHCCDPPRLCGLGRSSLGWILLVFLIIMVLTTTLLTHNSYASSDTKDWILVGGINSTGATFRIRTDATSAAQTLVVKAQANGSEMILYNGEIPTDDYVATVTLDNLDPDTFYVYQTKSSSNQVIKSGSFSTPSAELSRMNFTIAASGCAWTGSNSDVFDRIADTSPLLFVHLGDLHYEDLNVDNVERRIEAIDTVMSSTSQSNLFSKTSLVYIWDDHDWLGNDSGGAGVGRDAALESYRIGFPYYEPLPALATTTASEVSPYHAFTVGTVRFILSDVRSESTVQAIYSDEQRAWLYNEISQSANYDFVVWITSKPWIGSVDLEDDAWWGYPDDRAELSDFIVQNVPNQNFIALSADAHMVGFDDGRNTYFGANVTDDVASFPILQTGPLDRLGSAKGGPFSDGCHAVKYERNHQYSTINFQMPESLNEEACMDIKSFQVDGTQLLSKRLCGRIFATSVDAVSGSCESSAISGGSIALISIAGALLALSIIVVCITFGRYESCITTLVLVLSFFTTFLAGFGIPFALGVAQYETFTILLIVMIQMLFTFAFTVIWSKRKRAEHRS